MLLTCCCPQVLWLSFRKTLQNAVDSIDVVSAKCNSPISSVVTRLINDIAMAFDAPAYVEDGATRRRGEFARDGRSIPITRRPRVAQA